jgi:hypothetical protein
MAANRCMVASIRVCAYVLSPLDPDGSPTGGAQGIYVAKSPQKVVLTAEVEAGAETIERTSCNELAVNDKQPPIYKRLTAALDGTNFDPYLIYALGTGTILDAGGTRPPGWSFPELGVSQPAFPVSFEFYTERHDPVTGKAEPDWPWDRRVLPFCEWRWAQVGEFGNSAAKPAWVADCYANPFWLNGPLNDWPAGVASDRAFFSLPWATLPTNTDCSFDSFIGS